MASRVRLDSRSGRGFVLRADVPGVKFDDVRIEVNGAMLDDLRREGGT